MNDWDLAHVELVLMFSILRNLEEYNLSIQVPMKAVSDELEKVWKFSSKKYINHKFWIMLLKFHHLNQAI